MLNLTRLKDIYKEIRSKLLSKTTQAVIYACYDLDSICAAKILTVTLWYLTRNSSQVTPSGTRSSQ